jgi:pimeloyl-ACP methyl ester carboxylesterase
VILPGDERGSGAALVLLHAGIADRRIWADLLDPLAEAGARVFAPDLPGFGDTSVPAAPSAPWRDVLDTLDAHGIERFVLAGNSFGGSVAKRVAVLAPDRVAGLALISAPPEDDQEPSPELQAVWEAEEEALEREDLDAAVAAVVEAWTLRDAPAPQRELVAQMQRRAFELQLAAGEQEWAPDPLEQDRDALARFDAPVLVAHGEHEMPDFPAAAQELVATLPRARLEVIAGAGHLAPLERPDAVLELLAGLLAEALPA